MKSMKKWIPVFLFPSCLLFVLIYLLPLLLVISTSFYDYRLLPKRFDFVGFQNYINLFTNDRIFRIALKNTSLWIAIHCTIHVFLGVFLAFILYKKPKGWKFVRIVYMIPNIISQAAIAMIFVNIFNPSFGMLNGFLNTIGLDHLQRNWLFDQRTAFLSVTMTWLLFAGYTTTMVLAQALSVDETLIQAAKVDGASDLQIDWYIMLPLVRKMIGTTVVMAAGYMLQMFSLIYITTKGGPGNITTNLPLQLYATALKENNYGYANTIGVCIIILGFISMKIINRVFKMDANSY